MKQLQKTSEEAIRNRNDWAALGNTVGSMLGTIELWSFTGIVIK